MSFGSLSSLVSQAGGFIFGQISGKSKANELYKVLVPELKEALERGTPITDEQVQRLIKAISELPSSGAKRRNFVRRYMEDRYTMLTLPNDPNSIMYGYWW
ncbi:hypothetical protein [Aliivibrio fischeri]|uniref:hypothetical protein n=1 Tax=Aliivibrio fischeri TaxID=668 RepID=UPI0012DAA153|nr:hypothetical protein [Aliivibrio fischeri]MUJ22577.1 hypothetical protein [Aliivibrio fischeri]